MGLVVHVKVLNYGECVGIWDLGFGFILGVGLIN